MRALTVKQPWASAIASGQKTIENRTWEPPKALMGELIAIHAGKAFDRRGADLGLSDGPRGAIIAVARIDRVITRSRSLWFTGPVGWVLTDIVALESPIPCRGALGLWEVGPSDVVSIRRQVTDCLSIAAISLAAVA